MNFNFLSPILITHSGTDSELYFMDINSKEIYQLAVDDGKFKLQKLDESITDYYFEQLSKEEKQTDDKIPYEEIFKVLNTEKQISEQNSKHIFRRS